MLFKFEFVPSSSWFFCQSNRFGIYAFYNQRLLESFRLWLYVSDLCEIYKLCNVYLVVHVLDDVEILFSHLNCAKLIIL